ncbi:hypothetical protein Mapa_006425 [Marchantia paleacea]|nr:hypothetical protein Mapa_006425 [Marchantia paleacea]
MSYACLAVNETLSDISIRFSPVKRGPGDRLDVVRFYRSMQYPNLRSAMQQRTTRCQELTDGAHAFLRRASSQCVKIALIGARSFRCMSPSPRL